MSAPILEVVVADLVGQSIDAVRATALAAGWVEGPVLTFSREELAWSPVRFSVDEAGVVTAAEFVRDVDRPAVGDVLESARVRLRAYEEARASDRAAREPMSDTAWAGVELAAVMPELVAVMPELVAEVERLRALVPPGAGDPRDPAVVDSRCRRCARDTQWGWCPVCQAAEFGALP